LFWLQSVGPQPTFVSDAHGGIAGFLQSSLTPIENVISSPLERFEHFNHFGTSGLNASRVYKIGNDKPQRCHSRVATGGKVHLAVRTNFRKEKHCGLNPKRSWRWTGSASTRFCENVASLWARRLIFNNDLSNGRGFNGLFKPNQAQPKRGARKQIARAPIARSYFSRASYTYLDAEKTSSADIRTAGAPFCRGGPATMVYVRFVSLVGKSSARTRNKVRECS